MNSGRINEIDYRINEIMSDINGYMQLLTMTDYKAIKHAEGWLSEDEYAETKTKRQSYRDEINKLEAELAELEEERASLQAEDEEAY